MVDTLITGLPEFFSKADTAEWDKFWKTYPSKPSAIPRERRHPVQPLTDIAQCAFTLPTNRHLAEFQARYAESISYTNPISTTSVTAQALRDHRVDLSKVPILKQGAYVCVLPDEESLQQRQPRGERTAFWLARIEEDEAARTDEFGARAEAPKPDDKFKVAYMGVFDKKGHIINSVVGSWALRCTHKRTARSQVHAFEEGKCCRSPQKLIDTISRDSILLYEVEFTALFRVNQNSQAKIKEVLHQHEAAYNLLPSSWVKHETGRKRKSRRR